MPVRLSASCIAEFIGSFALTFIGIMAIYHSGGNLLAIALAHGIVLAVAVTACWSVSGGHINPAITIGLMAAGKIKPGAAVAYILAQLAGGVVAALLAFVIAKHIPGAAAVSVVVGGTPNPGKGIPAGTALLCEMIATFLLSFAVWGTAADPRAKYLGGWAIGLTIAVDILAVGPISGASMNPQRSFGPTLVASFLGDQSSWGMHWIYWVGPIIGAVAAAILYHTFLWPRDEYGREPGAKDVPTAQRT